MGRINRSEYTCSKRQEKAKMIKVILVLALLSCLLTALNIGSMSKSMDSVSLNNINDNLISTVSSNSSSSIVIESTTGAVIDGVNIDARLPMASTTKIMTAYLAVESGKLDNYVKTPEYATKVEGSSIYLKSGEQVKLIDLVYGLMLRSGNDSAVTIADYLAGSIEGFAVMMNDKVTELGLTNTNFVNPHGLHDDNHYTSASDLAIITKHALDNNIFRDISATKSHRCTNSDGDVKVFINKNKLLKAYPDCIGVKTGYTKAAGRCLVSASERDGVRAICVVLNHPDMWQDSKCYLEKAQDSCKSINYLKKNDIIDQVKSKSGQILNAVVLDDINIVMFKNKSYNINYSIEYDENMDEIVENNEIIGRILIFNGKHLLFVRNIYNMNI